VICRPELADQLLALLALLTLDDPIPDVPLEGQGQPAAWVPRSVGGGS
jgi:hypothetical protein